MLDPTLASRLQFALTTMVHIVFPVISMGLAPFLVYFTWKEIRTGDPLYVKLQRFWLRVFAITFVMGTVTGITLEFEFGTNFAAYSTAMGGIFGGPLATEGLMAFFLESTMLGIFVFGRDRVSDWTYFLSGVLVAVGSWLSAVWILIANSWMQTPRGYEMVMRGGQEVAKLTDPVAAYLNPRFPWMFVHMQSSAVLSVALFMAGLAAYQVRYGDDTPFWRTTLKFGILGLAIAAPFQVLHGDLYARHVFRSQPQKFAAMEALWETSRYVPEYIVAFPTSPDQLLNPRAKDLFGIGIPGGASWLASGGDPNAQITGLNAFDSEAPPVAIVFWSFRIMVALGFWFVLLGFWGAYRWWTGELFEDHLLHRSLAASTVLGILGVELGWVVAEVGRQPWVIQDVLKTSEGVSPGLTGGQATLTLLGFVGLYTGIFLTYGYVLRRLIREGPPEVTEQARDAEAETGEVPAP